MTQQQHYDVFAGTVAIVNRSAVRLSHPEQGLGRWLTLEKDVSPPAAGDEVVCYARPATFSVYQVTVLTSGRERRKRERVTRQALASKQAEGEDVIVRGVAPKPQPAPDVPPLEGVQ